MSVPSKSLWLIAPPILILVAWFVTQRNGAGESAAASNKDFILIAGSLLAAFALSVTGIVFSSRSHDSWAPMSRPSTSGRSRTQRLRVVQSLRISPRDWVHAIEFDSTTFLIGASDGNMVLLDSIRDSADESFTPASYSDEGIDLCDTPRTEDATSPTPRNLASSGVGRAALTDANLAEFKARLEHARKSLV
jgi:flagellar biogenesis protein FliO